MESICGKVFGSDPITADHGCGLVVDSPTGQPARTQSWMANQMVGAADGMLLATLALRTRTLAAKDLSSSEIWRSNQYSA